MLIGIRQGAAAQGADEALLVSGSGTVLEGALSAVLWWRGDVLCAPPQSLPVLPSVTRRSCPHTAPPSPILTSPVPPLPARWPSSSAMTRTGGGTGSGR